MSDLEAKLAQLATKTREHREIVLTEEAAKTALVMPFIQALGYDVFDPKEVVPESVADVGTKLGKKVDYAIYLNGKIQIIVECKPANVALDINHATQLYQYFAVSDARVGVLTNGVVYKFFTDAEKPNLMDSKPFFTFELGALKKSDIATLARFTKSAFSVTDIVAEAAKLKSASVVYAELVKEFATPSDELVKLIASRVTGKPVTQATKATYRDLIVSSVSAFLRDKVNERLTSALTASNPPEAVAGDPTADEEKLGGPVVTTQDEIDGFNIIPAIASKSIDPAGVMMRDAQKYCAILLDDNNRKTIARLRFNSLTTRHLGLFAGKDETFHKVTSPIDIYQHDDAILKRIGELAG